MLILIQINNDLYFFCNRELGCKSKLLFDVTYSKKDKEVALFFCDIAGKQETEAGIKTYNETV